LLAFYVVWLLRASLTGAVSRLTGFACLGVKFALSGGEQALAAAFEIANKNPEWAAQASERDREKALEKRRRAAIFTRAPKFCGWTIVPPTTATNRACCAASAPLSLARQTRRDAVKDAHSQARPFHILLSDISRDLPPPPNPRGGLDMLAAFRAQGITLPVIFYVGQFKADAGTPADGFGITDRPDILLTLVGEALERARAG
jgi:hypothetical protein